MLWLLMLPTTGKVPKKSSRPVLHVKYAPSNNPKLAESLTLHTDDVSRLNEVLHVVRRVGVYATVSGLHRVPPG